MYSLNTLLLGKMNFARRMGPHCSDDFTRVQVQLILLESSATMSIQYLTESGLEEFSAQILHPHPQPEDYLGFKSLFSS